MVKRKTSENQNVLDARFSLFLHNKQFKITNGFSFG